MATRMERLLRIAAGRGSNPLITDVVRSGIRQRWWLRLKKDDGDKEVRNGSNCSTAELLPCLRMTGRARTCGRLVQCSSSGHSPSLERVGMEPGDKNRRDATVGNVVRSSIHQAPKFELLKRCFLDLADPVGAAEFATGKGGDHVEHCIGETTDVEDVLTLLGLS